MLSAYDQCRVAYACMAYKAQTEGLGDMNVNKLRTLSRYLHISGSAILETFDHFHKPPDNPTDTDIVLHGSRCDLYFRHRMQTTSVEVGEDLRRRLGQLAQGAAIPYSLVLQYMEEMVMVSARYHLRLKA